MTSIALKSALVPVLFSGVTEYTLTTSNVASDAIPIPFTKRMTLYPYYKAGVGAVTGVLDITIEINPYYPSEDPSGAYWSQISNFIDTSGVWTEELADYRIGQGVAGAYRAGSPISLSNIDAVQVRFKVKEINPGAAGACKLLLVKNELT
jgi:hypothetical protein